MLAFALGGVMKPFLKTLCVLTFALLLLAIGFLLGNIYRVFDLLCPASPKPHVLRADFISPDGILFPAGTIVPLKQCAYMQRFDWSFAIDAWVSLPAAEHPERRDYGHSLLSEKPSEKPGDETR
jgi:hypothetical protein